MAKTPRTRHLRHDLVNVNTDRSHRRRFLGFVDQEVTKFDSTGASIAISSVTTTDTSAATGTLTMTGNALNGETVTVGSQNYEFKNSLGGASDSNGVLIGSDADESLTNLADAINSNNGTRGTAYGFEVGLNSLASAQDNGDDTMTVTALMLGTEGNTIPTNETLTNGSFGGATLSGGAEGNTLESGDNGLSSGDGPFHLLSDGTLPGGTDSTTLYYIYAVDGSLFKLMKSKANAVAEENEVDLTSAGTGSITLEPAVTTQSIIEHIRDGELPSDMVASTDIDDFA